MIYYLCGRAARPEGAAESGGAAEQHRQVLEGRRRRLKLLVQPLVQTFGKTA